MGVSRAVPAVLAAAALTLGALALTGCTASPAAFDPAGPPHAAAAASTVPAAGPTAVRLAKAAYPVPYTQRPVPPAAPPPPRPSKPWETQKFTGPATALPSPTPTPTPTAAASPPVGPCLPLYGPGASVPLRVSSRPGSVTVTWYHNGDPATRAYYVGLQPRFGSDRQQLTVTWTRVPPSRLCLELSQTLTGLLPGRPYTVWLDIESTTPEVIGGTTRRSLNRLDGITG